MSTLRPAVFLDRDGTLNAQIVRDGKPYPPATLAEFRLLDGAAEACARLKAAGFALVVATNQPDVGRGTQPQTVVEAMHARLRELIPALDRIEVCYEPGGTAPAPGLRSLGEGGSPRRKPAPGMLRDAAAALGLDLARSWMVGDRWRDIDAGHAAGCRTVFIDWGYAEPLRARPDFVAKNIAEAAEVILAASER